MRRTKISDRPINTSGGIAGRTSSDGLWKGSFEVAPGSGGRREAYLICAGGHGNMLLSSAEEQEVSLAERSAQRSCSSLELSNL